MKGRRLVAIAGATAVATIAAVVGMAAAGVFDSNDDRAASAQGAVNSNTINRIYERERRSVYFVQTSGAGGGGTGTAWLFDADGHLVTNQHVISAGSDVALRVGENELLPVTVVGEDASTDLAVLQAAPDALSGGDPLRLAEASEVSSASKCWRSAIRSGSSAPSPQASSR